MRLTALDLGRNGITISIARARQIISNTYKKFGYACRKLYELGVTSDPSFCNIADIRKYMKANYSSEFAYFYDTTIAHYDFSSKRIAFVMDCHKDLACANMLSYARMLIQCYEDLEVIDELVRNNALGNKNKQIKPKITVGGSIHCNGKLPLDAPIVLQMFERTAGSRLVEIDTRHIFVKYLCKFADIDEAIFEKYMTENKALFVKELTFKQELDYLKEIVNLEVELTGDYGKVLHDKIVQYNAENFNKDAIVYTVLYKINLDSIDERCAETEKARKVYGTGFIRNFYVTFDKTYIEISSAGEDIKNIYSYSKYGNYVVDYLTGEALHPYNLFEGYNGEFISEADVKKYGYKTFGLPVPLITDVVNGNILTANYYPSYVVTDVKDGVDCFKGNAEFMLHSETNYTFESVYEGNPTVELVEQFKKFCDMDDNIFTTVRKVEMWLHPYCTMNKVSNTLEYLVKDMLTLFIYFGKPALDSSSSDFFLSLIQETNYYKQGVLLLDNFLKCSKW